MDLCAEADVSSRVVSGEELELFGQLDRSFPTNRKRSLGSAGVLTAGEEDGDEDVEDEGMDIN